MLQKCLIALSESRVMEFKAIEAVPDMRPFHKGVKDRVHTFQQMHAGKEEERKKGKFRY